MVRAVVTAYAKVNLVLDVLKKRDDGYHEVVMVMQAVNLADRLTILPAEANQLKSDNPYIPMNMNNLAMKAVTLMQDAFPDLPPLQVTLDKRIPVAAGLAGGSTDSAAVLLGINRLFGLGLKRRELQVFAAQLGSDVPFCLRGPTALATGRGDVLEDLPVCPKLWLVLVKPTFGVSTPSVYKNLDLQMVKTHPQIAEYVQHLKRRNVQSLLKGMGNVLEISTFAMHPSVALLKQEMESMGGKYTLMSGSGPTVFSVFTERKRALNFYRKCQKRFKQVYLTETVSAKMINERVMIDG